ncbi:MAG: hypothetical protein Q7K98_03520 [Candidatus Omnitrophota bacterium]|nr:hypothetical protein [Candidatus Omnitrophota bacterium]
MTRFRILALLFLFSVCSTAFLSAADETLTITTYYPSPYGSYNSLQTSTLGVGDNNGDTKLTSADVPTTVGDVWIKGKVGIGTTTPGTKLEVNGQIKITGGNPGAGKVLTSDANGVGSWQGGGAGLVQYGGSYLVEYMGGTCTTPNIVTSNCSCPAGYSARMIAKGEYYYYQPWDAAHWGYACEKY